MYQHLLGERPEPGHGQHRGVSKREGRRQFGSTGQTVTVRADEHPAGMALGTHSAELGQAGDDVVAGGELRYLGSDGLDDARGLVAERRG